MLNPQRKRARWHNYRSRCIYLITINKAPGIMDFGKLTGDWRQPLGSPNAPSIALSSIGKIVRNALFETLKAEPKIRLLQYAVMPDHLHFLLFVTEELPEEIGHTIARFKLQASRSVGLNLFTESYNDQILDGSRNLDTLFRYLRDNPYRLAVRQGCPDHFTRKHEIIIGDRVCETYGHQFLLNHPFKAAVAVHSSDDEATRYRKLALWRYYGANGSVLISPFISQAERSVRDEAEALGARFILIKHQPLGERFKPTGIEFALCTQGRLLIVAPREPLCTSPTPSRAACVAMNAMATAIAQLTNQG